jgi:hypothetical protein
LASSQANATAEQQSISDLTSLVNSLSSAITAVSTTSLADERAQAMAVLSTAASTGNLSDTAGISAAVTSVQKDASSLFSTMAQYQNSQAVAGNALMIIQADGTTQLSAAQQQLLAMQATTTAVQADMTATTTTLNGMAAADAATVAAQTQTLTDAETLRYNAEVAANTANDAAVNANLDGILATAQAQLNAINGVNASVLTVATALSSFGAALAVALGTPGVTTTSATDMLANLPALAVGTNSVPEDMFAQIHKGERIIPAADNVALMKKLNTAPTDANAQSNAAVADKLDTLIQLIRVNDAAAIKDLDKFTRIVSKWEGNGLPPTRTVT